MDKRVFMVWKTGGIKRIKSRLMSNWPSYSFYLHTIHKPQGSLPTGLQDVANKEKQVKRDLSTDFGNTNNYYFKFLNIYSI